MKHYLFCDYIAMRLRVCTMYIGRAARSITVVNRHIHHNNNNMFPWSVLVQKNTTTHFFVLEQWYIFTTTLATVATEYGHHIFATDVASLHIRQSPQIGSAGACEINWRRVCVWFVLPILFILKHIVE